MCAMDWVTLEVNISYALVESEESPEKVKPEFWLLESTAPEAKDSASLGNGAVQHLTVRFSPRQYPPKPDVFMTDRSVLPPQRSPRTSK